MYLYYFLFYFILFFKFVFLCSVVRSSLARASLRSTVAFNTRSFAGSAPAPSTASSADIVVPEFVDTLEWILDSPPTLHQFDEPPIIVEVAHLM
jgi:hypothetical protein